MSETQSASQGPNSEAVADGAIPPAVKTRTPFKWVEIDGVFYPGFIVAEQLEKLKSFKPRPHDIFVCTYPKGGSHWIGFIVHLVMNNGVENRETPFHHICPWLEAAGLPESGNIHDLEKVERLPDPRFFYSHAYYGQMPGGPPNTSPAKYIYVARNPKDTFVSFYHFHVKSQEWMVFGRTWDQFFDEFVKGRVFFGSWWDQIPEWWKHGDEKNVLFLKYEDLKRDLPKYVQIIADFLGYDLEQEVIMKIASMCTFEEMKNNTAMGANSQSFIRKGVVGDWKGQLSEEESEIIDRRYAEAVKGTGLEFDFGD